MTRGTVTTLRRTCRNPACRRQLIVSIVVAGCRVCLTPYGPITLGLDVDPKEVRAGLRDMQAVMDREHRERMEEGRRADIARLVAGMDEPDP